ncbi:MAG: hypothetical protein AMXMBFR33_50510 [Candidatus Xenobia bacterium]
MGMDLVLAPSDRLRYPLPMTLLHVHQRQFTVDEYNRMAETGVLREGERVELIEGVIVPLSAHNPTHSDAVASTTTVLVIAFGKDHFVRVQLPLEVSGISEPEPDFTVVPRKGARMGQRQPCWAPLVIEVANTSLAYDRTEKASLYARAQIPDYWILNVADRQVEVYREPAEDPSGFFGWKYQSLTILRPGQTVTPCALTAAPLDVEEMLG